MLNIQERLHVRLHILWKYGAEGSCNLNNMFDRAQPYNNYEE